MIPYKTAFLELLGHKTRYLAAGSGPPVVLVHGSGAGVSAEVNWDSTIRALATDHAVYAIELFGFGGSDKDPNLDYGISLWSAQLTAFVQRLGLGEPVIIGNSLGGWVTLDALVAEPGLAAGVVLMGTGGTRLSDTKLIRAHLTYVPSREGMREVLRDFVYDPSLISDDMVETRFRNSSSESAATAYELTTAARARDRVHRPVDLENIGQLDLPALIVHGANDQIIPSSSSLAIAAAMTRADLYVFGRCGHWAQIERASLFNVIVSAFLAEVRQSSDAIR